jgi:hypothetical protein
MKDVSQVGYTNVAEALIETVPDLRARYAEELRGPRTRPFSKEIEDFWGRER